MTKSRLSRHLFLWVFSGLLLGSAPAGRAAARIDFSASFSPTRLVPGDHPAYVVIEVGWLPHDAMNVGGIALFEFILSTNDTVGDSDDLRIGQIPARFILQRNETDQLVLTAAGLKALTIPANASGTYQLFVRASFTDQSAWDHEFAGNFSRIAQVAVGPPQLVSPRWTNGVFSVAVQTSNGRTYNLQYKNAASDPIWTPLAPITGNGTVLVLTVPAANTRQRFYRVAVGP